MKRSHSIAGGLALLSILWVTSGTFRHAILVRAEPLPVQDANAPARVRAVRLKAEDAQDTITINGQTSANRIANLSAEVAGQVKRIVLPEGSPVKTGDPIIEIAVEDRETSVASARALVAQREKEYAAALRLKDKGFNSDISLKNAAAQLETAKSNLRRTEISLDKTVIRAPFDGIFNMQSVHVGDFVTAGTKMANVVDLDPIKIVGYASERALNSLTTGQEVDVRLITGTTFNANITYVSASADIATRTFRIEAEAPNPDSISDGMTAEMRITGASRKGYNISPAILTLSDSGEMGLMIIDEKNIARFMPIEILSASPEGIWVGGLPDTVTLITTGQEYAIPGEKVDPVFEEPAGKAAQ
ncbi:MAG TPA: hypothetical protein DCW68_04395 [Rhodospirillaceae bacterium]|nr:MAG: hypothetical protein A2018_03255 [Alphaproteobacteria bacterium GWF2_58_20]HAU29336.1 hypothetical protein [Rhodospirillaceae bacterium]